MYVGYSEVVKFLKNCEDAVIIIHQSPDGDCIGAGFGLSNILSELGICSKVVCSEEFPSCFKFITGPITFKEFIPKTIIAVDIADTKLMGTYEEIYGHKVHLCIDHHKSNKNYAEMTLLKTKTTATCEIIYDLSKYMGVNISRYCAMCLYTGIATDSGCFKYECTTPHAHEIVAEMKRKYDVNFSYINYYMFEVKSKSRMLFETKFCEYMEEYLDGKLIIYVLTKKTIDEIGIKSNELSGLASMTIQLEGTKIGILICEFKPNIFKCSFRSSTDDCISVLKICQTFGGGGHEKAAGCTIEGNLEQVKKMIIDVVKGTLE